MLKDISNIKTVFICPDHNEKYNQRKEHMINLLTKIGIKNFSHYKSNTNMYPRCLTEANIDILEQNMNDEPILILEDDVEWTGISVFEPLNCDAIYLGLSRCGGSRTSNTDLGVDSSVFQLIESNSQLRVINMLATHSIIYISRRYKQVIVETLKKNLDCHMDVVISRIQSDFMILANKIPLFYQSSGFGNVQHVENMTKFTLLQPNDPYFSFEKRNCTIVTAYYEVETRKHSINEYIKWAKNLMELENPIVLFTSLRLSNFFKTMRGNKPIVIVELEFEDLYTWKKYKNKWIEHHSLDPEKNIHSPELYSVWADKPFFLEKAIEKNYFNTTHFLWCDIGAFRESDKMYLFKNFPMTNYFQKDKILFLAINPLQQTDKEPNLISTVDRIGAGLFGGDRVSCLRFKDSYEETLLHYFFDNRFAGKEQQLILSTYLKDTSLGFMVKHNVNYIYNGNNLCVYEDYMWFYLEYILSGKSIVEYDKSYITNVI